MSGTVRSELDGPIGWVIIDNQPRRNALSAAMFAQLAQQLRALDVNPEVRVIVLRGAGNGAFAAGADISELNTTIERPATTSERVFSLSTPTVAMIQGACMGAGMLLALSADVRIASDDARFAVPAVRLGIAYPYAGVLQMVAAAGPAAAAEILLTGAAFDATDAARWGLVSRVVAKEQLESTVGAVVAAIASGAPLSVRAVKTAIAAVLAGSPPDAVADAEKAIQACWESEDLRRGQRAFAEKRASTFEGK
ncbi:MAG TPA: enoyl-CoA hydratase-related protein [Acidimicrobiales bacterium]|nr:enoyl-CoA hydratase-related protein [Acidimicrobiales bacterium]